MKSFGATMQMIFTIIHCKLIFFSVECKFSFGNTVSITSDKCSEKYLVRRQIFVNGFKTGDYIPEFVVFVFYPKIYYPSAKIGNLCGHTIFVFQSVEAYLFAINGFFERCCIEKLHLRFIFGAFIAAFGAFARKFVECKK